MTNNRRGKEAEILLQTMKISSDRGNKNQEVLVWEDSMNQFLVISHRSSIWGNKARNNNVARISI